MKLVNNTHQAIYYYIPISKVYGLLYFGEQLETLDTILSFRDVDEWKNHINTELATDTWFDDGLKQQVADLDSSKKYPDNGYLTNYNFRLSMGDEMEKILDDLINSNADPISLKAFSGDIYTIDRTDLIKIINQYKIDKPLYLAMVDK